MYDKGQTQSQLKNQQFRKEIRNRMKADYMKTIRNEFLRIENESQSQTGKQELNATIKELQSLINQAASKDSLTKMNRIMIIKRQDIDQELYERFLSYAKINFLNKETGNLGGLAMLNDLIALFCNLMAFSKYQQIFVKEFNLKNILEKLISFIGNVPVQSGSLLLWAVFQLIQIGPAELVERVADIQLDLRQKFTVYNINLSYIICSIAEHRPDLLSPVLVQEYTQISPNAVTQKYFHNNLIIIFRSYIVQSKECQETDSIVKWITEVLISAAAPQVKQNSIKLFHCIVKMKLTTPVLINILSQPNLVNQLLQRSLYDTQSSNKTLSIDSLNELIKAAPQLQLQEFLCNYPSAIEVLVSALSLMQLDIVIGTLSSIGRIIMLWPNDSEIHGILLNSELRVELNSLLYSKNPQISRLATAILQDYFEEEEMA